jgi:hypothetical protein
VPDAHLAIFQEMAVILTLATAVGIVGVLLKQPLLIAFIVAGILAGPAGFDLIRSASNLNALADIGVAVLLFLIGLKLDMHIIRALGRVATATGLVVIQLKEKMPAQRENFEKEKWPLLNALRQAKAAEATARYVADLRRAAADKLVVKEAFAEEPKISGDSQ